MIVIVGEKAGKLGCRSPDKKRNERPNYFVFSTRRQTVKKTFQKFDADRKSGREIVKGTREGEKNCEGGEIVKEKGFRKRPTTKSDIRRCPSELPERLYDGITKARTSYH